VAMLADIAYWGMSSKPMEALLVTIAPVCYRTSNSPQWSTLMHTYEVASGT